MTNRECVNPGSCVYILTTPNHGLWNGGALVISSESRKARLKFKSSNLMKNILRLVIGNVPFSTSYIDQQTCLW